MRLLTPPAVGALVWGLPLTTTAGARPLGEAASEGPPNIIYRFADDLGCGDLGSYGQGRIRTPRPDRLAAEGIRFTDHYSGSNVRAPSRASLMTGKHQGDAGVRNNFEVVPWGQYPLASGEVTIATPLKGAGYATAAIGKWGLGPVGSEGDPANHGFDLFFGYNCRRQAPDRSHLLKSLEARGFRGVGDSPPSSMTSLLPIEVRSRRDGINYPALLFLRDGSEMEAVRRRSPWWKTIALNSPTSSMARPGRSEPPSN